jgi:hypothetical protein
MDFFSFMGLNFPDDGVSFHDQIVAYLNNYAFEPFSSFSLRFLSCTNTTHSHVSLAAFYSHAVQLLQHALFS